LLFLLKEILNKLAVYIACLFDFWRRKGFFFKKERKSLEENAAIAAKGFFFKKALEIGFGWLN